MADQVVLTGDRLEGVMLDAIYESWNAVQVMHDQIVEGFPDLTEEDCLVATDRIVGMHMSQIHRLTQTYNVAALRPTHRQARTILQRWHEQYVQPTTPESEVTARWMQGTLDCLMGLHQAIHGKHAPYLTLTTSEESN